MPVDVDDMAIIQARMKNGALGTIEASRVATGTVDKFPEPAALPGPRFAVGWMLFHAASQFDFLNYLVSGKRGLGASFENGLRVQEVVHACQLSAKSKSWQSLA